MIYLVSAHVLNRETFHIQSLQKHDFCHVITSITLAVPRQEREFL